MQSHDLTSTIKLSTRRQALRASDRRPSQTRDHFSCGLESAVAANPYLQFSAKVEESGTFRFSWVDDDGITITAEEKITVS